MRHIHLDSCPSTQVYLKELVEKEGAVSPTLVSTSRQTEGHGRRGNTWLFFEDSLAFSFTLKPHPVLTLSSLEIGILIIQFFETLNCKLQIKWPNDLMNERGEKCGGIIQQFTLDQLIVGVGINLSRQGATLPKTDIPIGSLDLNISAAERRELPKNIVEFITRERLDTSKVKKLFTKYHIYQNELVSISDEEKKVSGKFIGIGDFGEALLETAPGKIEKMITGTLRLSAT